jgi:hypothetical protein
MLTLAGIVPLAGLLLVSGTARASDTTPQLQQGNKCVYIYSPDNWRATVCAIVNYDDARADTYAQELFTFSVRSGAIAYVDANSMYLTKCNTTMGGCPPTHYTVVNEPGSSGHYISGPWMYVGVPPVQALYYSHVVTPCVFWTNGQIACYDGTLTSYVASG